MLKRSLSVLAFVTCITGVAVATLTFTGPVAHAAPGLPPPGTQTYTGTLDPIFWRAMPPAGRRFLVWEKWAINKTGRPALAVDVSAVVGQANAAANKKIVAYGRYRTGTTPEGQTVRYLHVESIQVVQP